MCLVFLCFWSSYVFGLPMFLVFLCFWSSYVFGLPMFLVFLCLWSSYVFGLPMSLVFLFLVLLCFWSSCFWSSYVFGLPISLVFLCFWSSCFWSYYVFGLPVFGLPMFLVFWSSYVFGLPILLVFLSFWSSYLVGLPILFVFLSFNVQSLPCSHYCITLVFSKCMFHVVQTPTINSLCLLSMSNDLTHASLIFSLMFATPALALISSVLIHFLCVIHPGWHHINILISVLSSCHPPRLASHQHSHLCSVFVSSTQAGITSTFSSLFCLRVIHPGWHHINILISVLSSCHPPRLASHQHSHLCSFFVSSTQAGITSTFSSLFFVSSTQAGITSTFSSQFFLRVIHPGWHPINILISVLSSCHPPRLASHQHSHLSSFFVSSTQAGITSTFSSLFFLRVIHPGWHHINILISVLSSCHPPRLASHQHSHLCSVFVSSTQAGITSTFSSLFFLRVIHPGWHHINILISVLSSCHPPRLASHQHSHLCSFFVSSTQAGITSTFSSLFFVSSTQAGITSTFSSQFFLRVIHPGWHHINILISVLSSCHPPRLASHQHCHLCSFFVSSTQAGITSTFSSLFFVSSTQAGITSTFSSQFFLRVIHPGWHHINILISVLSSCHPPRLASHQHSHLCSFFVSSTQAGITSTFSSLFFLRVIHPGWHHINILISVLSSCHPPRLASHQHSHLCSVFVSSTQAGITSTFSSLFCLRVIHPGWHHINILISVLSSCHPPRLASHQHSHLCSVFVSSTQAGITSTFSSLFCLRVIHPGWHHINILISVLSSCHPPRLASHQHSHLCSFFVSSTQAGITSTFSSQFFLRVIHPGWHPINILISVLSSCHPLRLASHQHSHLSSFFVSSTQAGIPSTFSSLFFLRVIHPGWHPINILISVLSSCHPPRLASHQHSHLSSFFVSSTQAGIPSTFSSLFFLRVIHPGWHHINILISVLSSKSYLCLSRCPNLTPTH